LSRWLDPERHKARASAYWDANWEQLAAKRRAAYAANPERRLAQGRVYRNANSEKIKARDRAYRDANREKIKAQQRAYRDANVERINAAQLERYWTESGLQRARRQLRIRRNKAMDRLAEREQRRATDGPL